VSTNTTPARRRPPTWLLVVGLVAAFSGLFLVPGVAGKVLGGIGAVLCAVFAVRMYLFDPSVVGLKR
jgi:hypothetical protein